MVFVDVWCSDMSVADADCTRNAAQHVLCQTAPVSLFGVPGSPISVHRVQLAPTSHGICRWCLDTSVASAGSARDAAHAWDSTYRVKLPSRCRVTGEPQGPRSVIQRAGACAGVAVQARVPGPSEPVRQWDHGVVDSHGHVGVAGVSQRVAEQTDWATGITVQAYQSTQGLMWSCQTFFGTRKAWFWYRRLNVLNMFAVTQTFVISESCSS